MLWLLCFKQGICQKQDYIWLSGYDSKVGFDSSTNTLYGISVMDFNDTPQNIYYDSIQMNFDRTNVSYCDGSGNLLFYTNGIYIANSLDEKIENSDSLNWGGIIYLVNPGIYKYGYRTFQGIVALEDPGVSNQYYIINTVIDTTAAGPLDIKKVVYHKLSLNANGGLGRVLDRNQTIIDGELSMEMAVIRHANGRDWWIIVRQQNTNCYKRILLSATGITAIQPDICLGQVFPNYDVGSFAVSPDGARVAHYCPRNGVQIFDFDRCEGLLTNVLHIATPGLFDSSYYFGGLCFSPSGRFLYLGATAYVFQYDTWAIDVAGSVDTVAVYDGAMNPFGSYFITMQMGPDGKIYESCGNAENVYHIIERPDEKGDSCLFIQHGIHLPTYSCGVPNFPNYRLGALAGSPCDTLTHIGAPTLSDLQIKLYPNPASEYVVIDYGTIDWGKGKADLQLTNWLGQLVYEQPLPMYSGFQKVAVAGFASGDYTVTISQGKQVVAKGKFSKL
ncbi:MAG: T9SS type A sorting domain-containing protein [Chitinophagales bacterium]